MNIIIYTIVVAAIIAILLGVLLGLFKKIFHVDTDPKVQLVRDALSGANCGGCGLAGCDAFASAVVKGDAPANGCVAGGSDCAKKVAEILGQAGVELKPKVAFLACAGSKDCAKDKAEYIGMKTCKAAQLTLNGTKKCAFGCIGFGDCVAVCPFEALYMGEDGLPKVNKAKCVGCGKCASVCPKHLFKLIDADTKGAIAVCSNKSDNKPQIRKDCTKGCIKCGMCVKKCPEQCIDISSGLPVIDYSKCKSCGICAQTCVDKVFVIL